MHQSLTFEQLLTIISKEHLSGKPLFLSLGLPEQKAEVFLLRNERYFKDDIDQHFRAFIEHYGIEPKWIKIDYVYKATSVLFDTLKQQMEQTRRNYIDYGVSFDNMWQLAFLPEEINANAMIRPDKTSKKLVLSEENINNYLVKYKSSSKHFNMEMLYGRMVEKFFTKSFFIEGENIYQLHHSGYRKGLRIVDDIYSEIDQLIESSVSYLENEIGDNGKYEYGYFPHFDKKIGFYNHLRHASSTYALLEGLHYKGASVTKAVKAIDYLKDRYYYEVDDAAYIFDDTNGTNEIKLGQNAAYIFMICEYLKHHEDEKGYLSSAQRVAEGILKLIDQETGETTHVLNYPDLTIKNKFRVIYYDGEAALALLRLYQVDSNEKWLNTVKQLFSKFIEGKYYQYHDHWLGYCTNELVKIVPEVAYFKFGIQNVAAYLDFIEKRETTFPTFLEMLVATYHLIQKAKQCGYESLISQMIDEEKLVKIIHQRADYQRTGFFYPELAMYFKNPACILGSFFIKHHGYRVRIDDIEHYVSGYVQYQKTFAHQSENKKKI